MNSSPAVSVIVPIYNVERYIEKCARSLFEQSLGNLEILFVDDCSPDNSIAIIKNILKNYPDRISATRIIRMPANRGQATARRQGIIEAKGEYIIHCDGDDWVDADLYKALYDKALSDDADIVCCDFIIETIKGSTIKTVSLSSNNGKDIIEQWYHKPMHMSCCNKLVKRSLCIDHKILPWVGLNMWEDNGLFLRLFYYATKVTNITGVYYHYNKQNDTSLSSTYGEESVRQMIEVAKNVTEFYSSAYDKNRFDRSIKALQFYARINLVTDSFKKLRDYRKTFPNCIDIIPHIQIQVFSPRAAIRFRFVKLHLEWLFVLLFKMRNLFCRFH